MSNKTIQLNPEFLSSSKSSSSSGTLKQKKEKPRTSLKPNAMKKQLLAKIKDFQDKSEKDKEDFTIKTDVLKEEEFNAGFADEFNKSLSFLSELSKQRKHKPKRNETLKRSKIEHTAAYAQIATELPEEMKVFQPKPSPFNLHTSNTPAPTPTSTPMIVTKPTVNTPTVNTPTVASTIVVPVVAPSTIAPQFEQPTTIISTNKIASAPSYGILKNGKNPTYRQYHNKTQKNYGNESVVKPLIRIECDKTNKVDEEPIVYTNPNPKQRFKRRITRTLKYSLGKHKNGKVSVLIKNAKTRRKIQTEQALLKQKSIADIKVYLRGKNLLKVGSDVPNDVLRQLYENAILAGDVTNKSKDTLIHNYFNEK